MENLVIFAVCAAIFGATALGIYFATMKRRTGVQVTLWTLLGLIVAWLVFMLSTASGWDGLIYFVALIFGAGPAGAGLALGHMAGAVHRAKPNLLA